MEKTFTIGTKSFVLDQTKAEAAFAAKRVINGRDTMAFNLLPLKYGWAYDLYSAMKANHWEPEDIPMGKDIEQWQSNQLTDNERWIIRMGIGYFSAAEGIVGDNIIPRRAGTRHRPRTQAGPGAPCTRGEHSCRQPALHDQLSGDQSPRVRGDVRANSDTILEKKNEFVTRIPLTALRRDHRS